MGMGGWVEGWVDGCRDGWMSGLMGDWLDGCMGGWVDGWIYFYRKYFLVLSCLVLSA